MPSEKCSLAEGNFDTPCSIPEHQEDVAAVLPRVVCVGSDDYLWAELLAQNLAARGVPVVRCNLVNLRDNLAAMGAGSLVVLDGGWPSTELELMVEELNPLLEQTHINAVMVVDDLVGPHPISKLTPDNVISRTPDMRVFVRKLLSLFQPPTQDLHMVKRLD